MNAEAHERAAWPGVEFERRLRALGARYHIHHPFHRAMHAGECSRRQIQGWVANRYYYQINIPLKDAALLANCPDRAVRRAWVQRLLDHDGQGGAEGGIEAWLRLGEAVGLARGELEDLRHVLPGVRFAVDAYVDFVRHAPWQEGICASLTELFAPIIHQQRLDGWPEHYPWIDDGGLDYFRKRLGEARRDVDHGLDFTLRHFSSSHAAQQRALAIVQFKLDVLWSMLDAMQLAYVLDMPPYFTCAQP
ncbi:MAG TPA: pyrroloquinoline-quinone synthase PqqC [Gammaproteobacteria bacterium]|nr:pyrroloquinoline-quinone synthase PqqC [Gammaproteobacteria bacterium]